jgi:hypothetical protein
MLQIDRQQLDVHKERAQRVLHEFYHINMRWSFYVIGGLLVVGTAINLIFTNGWMIWPFLLAAGVMSMVHEAAERNGQGVPPLYAYAFLFGGIAAWILIALIFSVVNPHVLFFGLAALGYQCLKGFLQERERTRVIEQRRSMGMCVHCGQLISEEDAGICSFCGNEPDPQGARLSRVASIVVGRKDPQQTRAALKPESHASSAKKKEAALLARHHARLRPKR